MRRLHDLIAHLPPESAVARKHGWWWTEQHETLAAIAELGHANVLATYAAAGADPKKLPKPLRVPRPHVDGGTEPSKPEKQPMTRQSVRSLLLAG